MTVSDNIFENLQFVVDLPITCPYKTKQALKETIIRGKGIVSYIINHNTNYLIRDLNADDSYKSRQAFKFGIPVIGLNFVEECIKACRLLDWRKFVPNVQKKNIKANVDNGVVSIKGLPEKSSASRSTFHFSTVKVWPYKDALGPKFYEHDHSIAKVAVLGGRSRKGIIPFAVLELHVLTEDVKNLDLPRFSVFLHHGTVNASDKNVIGQKDCRFFIKVNDALSTYQHLHKMYTNPPHSMQHVQHTFDVKIGSDGFFPEVWLPLSLSLDPSVAELVDHVWSEALAVIGKTIAVDLKTISVEKIENAKMLLHEIINSSSKSDEEVFEKHQELYSILPYKGFSDVHNQLRNCQVIQDMLALREMMDEKREKQVEEKYKALHCHIERLEDGDDEYHKVRKLINKTSSDGKIVIDGIYKVHRHLEHSEYHLEIGNEKLLFRGVPVQTVCAVLSRGFLTTDVDFSPQLNGVRFSGSFESAAKSAEKSGITGTRMVLVSRVALGNELAIGAKQILSDTEEFQSIHCVQRTKDFTSEFEDDEYIITNVNQQKIQYLVEIHLQGDTVTPLSLASTYIPQPNASMIESDVLAHKNVDLHQYLYAKSANAKVRPGLQSTSSKAVPLRAVHVRAKLVDLAAEVVLIQEYVNMSDAVIEAKYVFPLDDNAAVCGFEAFTEGRHFVGRIEEKHAARQEYQQAVAAGQKAFLMEEETAEVFSIKIGSISPHAVVLTKITYVAELSLEGELINFRVAGTVAPPQKEDSDECGTALGVFAAANLQTSVEVFLNMPFPIRVITSSTHKIHMKRTETQAVVAINKDEKLDAGFQLLVGLSEIHKPRMWVEEHPEFKTEACMLTFYPEFDVPSLEETEIIVAIDSSNSMSGKTFEHAQDIALLCLQLLPQQCKFNVVKFGTVYEELFPANVQHSLDAVHKAQQFVLNCKPQSGNSEIRHLLHTYFLLPPSADVQNILIVSDGHFNVADQLCSDVSSHREKTRIFTLAAGPEANRHLLRSLAFSGGGAYEHFDPHLISKWESKIRNIIANTQEPVLSNVSIEWQQFNTFDPPPVQAPKLITSVFSGNRLIVYGFVNNCSLATLKATVNGVELSSVINTTELAKSKSSVVSTLAARALVQDWEQGCLALNRTQHEVLKRSMKPQVIELSKKYKIVTSLTSFVAVEDKDEDSGNKGPATLHDLLVTHGVDFLDYISYESLDQEKNEANRDREVKSRSRSRSRSRSKDVEDDSAHIAKEQADKNAGHVEDEAEFKVVITRKACRKPVKKKQVQNVTKAQLDSTMLADSKQTDDSQVMQDVQRSRRTCNLSAAKKLYQKASKEFEIPQTNRFRTFQPACKKLPPFLAEIWDVETGDNEPEPEKFSDELARYENMPEKCKSEASRPRSSPKSTLPQQQSHEHDPTAHPLRMTDSTQHQIGNFVRIPNSALPGTSDLYVSQAEYQSRGSGYQFREPPPPPMPGYQFRKQPAPPPPVPTSAKPTGLAANPDTSQRLQQQQQSREDDPTAHPLRMTDSTQPQNSDFVRIPNSALLGTSDLYASQADHLHQLRGQGYQFCEPLISPVPYSAKPTGLAANADTSQRRSVFRHGVAPSFGGGFQQSQPLMPSADRRTNFFTEKVQGFSSAASAAPSRAATFQPLGGLNSSGLFGSSFSASQPLDMTTNAFGTPMEGVVEQSATEEKNHPVKETQSTSVGSEHASWRGGMMNKAAVHDIATEVKATSVAGESEGSFAHAFCMVEDSSLECLFEPCPSAPNGEELDKVEVVALAKKKRMYACPPSEAKREEPVMLEMLCKKKKKKKVLELETEAADFIIDEESEVADFIIDEEPKEVFRKGAKRHRKVLSNNSCYPLSKKLILDKSIMSLGSGLPFVSTILKLFPKRDWCYKDVWKYMSHLQEVPSPSDCDNHALLQDIRCNACNHLGGIESHNAPSSLKDFVDHTSYQLELLGLNSLSFSAQEAVRTLVASLASVFAICHTIDPSLLPLDLSDGARIKEQSEKLLKSLSCYPVWVQFMLYGLLIYVRWVNQSFPLLYHTLELGSTWEGALQKLWQQFTDDYDCSEP